MGGNGIKFIDSPVIKLPYFKLSRVKGHTCLRQALSGIVHIVEIVTEVHSMQFCTPARTPAKVRIPVYKFCAIKWAGVVSLFGRNQKAPDIAFVFRSTVCFNLVDSPVVGCAGNKTIRNSKSGKTNNNKCRCLVALERIFGTVVHIVKSIAEVHIVRGRSISR
ncbi:hypothetical protein ES703_89901 [subsurface metagenome]